MSLKYKLLFNTFLVLALCFLTLNSFASTQNNYYLNNTYSDLCTISFDDMCSAVAARKGNEASYRCDSYSVYYQIIKKTTDFYGNAGDVQNFDQPHGMNQRSLTCPDNTSFNLDRDTCTATCQTQDPCAQTKDVEENLSIQCGIMSCKAGATVEDLGAGVGMACSSGVGTFIPSSIPLKIKRGECEFVQSGAAEDPQDLGDVRGNSEDKGGQNAPTYCDVTYKGTGKKWVDTETPPTNKTGDPANNNAPFRPSLAAPNEDGGCNDGWTLGQVNGANVCAAPYAGQDGGGDGGSSGGDGSCSITGQTKVNGVCQCPTGQSPSGSQCVANNGTGGGDDGSGTGTGTGTGTGEGEGQGTYTGSNKCVQAPACSGDVVQCGLMAEQYKSKCEMLEQLGSVPDDVKQAANELGEEVTDNQDINGMKQAVTGYMNTLQSLVVPSNSACVISNIQLQILAKTIEIPLAQFCPFFELIRLMLNITIDLLVLRIVSRAVLSAG